MNKKVRNSYALLSVLTTALLLTGCGNKSSTTGGDTYTYNTYLSTNPKTWNVHTWQTSDESYITGFTEIGFYDCILNDTKDGYKFVTEMASAFPVDVTSQLSDNELDKFYSEKGNVDFGFAWDIALNPNAKWEDGTPIKADDYVESMKRQLDPEMGNFRADSYYASSFVIAGAEKYYKQGNETIEPLYAYIQDDGSFTRPGEVCYDNNYYINMGRHTPYIISVLGEENGLDKTLQEFLSSYDFGAGNAVKLAQNRIYEGVGDYLIRFSEKANPSEWQDIDTASKIEDEMWNVDINLDEFDKFEVMTRKDLIDSANKERYTSADLKDDLKTLVSGLGRGGATSSSWAWKYPLFGVVYNDFVQPWDGTDEGGYPTGVGLVKLDDYKIRLYLDKQISNLDLKFALSSNWLVNTALYDSLIVNTGGKKATNYATNSVNNYKSYGPYKLTKYENGKTIVMERNNNWYGYNDGNHVGQFQMTGIKTIIQSEHSTVVGLFEKGELDDLAMTKSDMKKYGSSSRKTTTYESFTQKISMNSNRSKLLSRQTPGVNKTILANDDFRKGFSLTLNRNQFASQTTAGSKAFTGLLNDLYLTDVAIGEMYRNTAQGKSVYDRVYGKLGGDPYAAGYEETGIPAKDNGYNFQMGIYYMANAIKTELESTQQGHLVNGDVLDFEFRVYDDTSETTVDMMNFFSAEFAKALQAAVQKVKESDPKYESLALSSKITPVKDENYYDTAKNGGYDFIFSVWGGAAINPYGLMQVYCDSTYDSNCEYGFKGKQSSVTLDIDVDGNGTIDAGETKSFHDWYTDLNNNYTEQDRDAGNFDQATYTEVHNKKLNILSGLEVGIINRYEAIPLVARGTSSLTSFKVENGTTNYISLVGYGGVRFLKFNYTDAQWSALINSSSWSADLYKD